MHSHIQISYITINSSWQLVYKVHLPALLAQICQQIWISKFPFAKSSKWFNSKLRGHFQDQLRYTGAGVCYPLFPPLPTFWTMCHILTSSAGHALLRSLYEENTSYYSQKKKVKLKVPKKVTNFVDFLEYDRRCCKKSGFVCFC